MTFKENKMDKENKKSKKESVEVDQDEPSKTVKRKKEKRKSEASEISEPKIKKFNISMKLQQNSVPEPTIENITPKKGPKIIIAKSKKAPEEDSKPAKKLNKVLVKNDPLLLTYVHSLKMFCCVFRVLSQTYVTINQRPMLCLLN